MKLTKSKLKQIIKEELKHMVEPFSDEAQEEHSDAYYELYDFLTNSTLPGDKPSEKLQSALRWIAKFEQKQDPWPSYEGLAPKKGLGDSSYEDTVAAYKENPEFFN
jgi:hypothetical protein